MIKKILFVLPLLLLINCGPEEKVRQRTYILLNNTGENIEIKFFKKYESRLMDSKLLSPNERYLGEELEKHQDFFNDPNEIYPSQSFFSSDSVVLIINNERFILNELYINSEGISFSEPIERNVFRQGNYEKLGSDSFIYKITNEDLETAFLCADSCD